MVGVAAVLGQDVVATAIGDALAASDDLNVVEGPPGSGKSYVAHGLGALWEEGGGCALVAEGDALQSDTALYPLSFALAALAPRWRAVGNDLASVGSAGERLGGTGGVITSTAQALLKLRPARADARKLFLGDAEQAVLFDLQRMGKRRPLLLIADNIHWWDARSLELLGRLREPRMVEAFGFLAHMRVIAIQTPEPYQQTRHPEALQALFAATGTRRHALTRPTREAFGAVLREFGARADLGTDVVDDVFRLTGGHLALADRCARSSARNELADLLAGSDNTVFVERLLTDRLTALGGVGSAVVGMLQIAAVLGLTFRRSELVCASGQTPDAVARMLRTCRDEDIVELSDAIGRFAHDILREHFLHARVGDPPTLHASVAECLRVLRPADYELRCVHLARAEQMRDAATAGALALLQLTRDGVSESQWPKSLTDAVEAGELDEVTRRLARAWWARERSKFAVCRSLLDALPRRLPKPLAAEADLIRAANLIATRDEADRRAGLDILETWDDYEHSEPDIGLRLLQERAYGLCLDLDKRPGQAIERRIRRLLMDRADADRAAEDALYILDRSAGSFHEADVALVRIEEAARYFRPGRAGDVIRRPIELYRTLTNLSAKQVGNARYDDALETDRELTQLVSDFEEGTFPRVDYPMTTAVSAALRAGRITPAVARERQQAVVTRWGSGDDPLYPVNALAVFALLSGDAAEAERLFAELQASVRRRRVPAPSAEYLVEANWCAARYVSGDAAPAIRRWSELSDVVVQIPYLARDQLIRRHDLLLDVMKSGSARESAVAFDDCLLSPPRFGPMWSEIGRGFWVPAVEWWH